MLLKSLKLENIRSYTKETINFSHDSTLLIGDIGCGKTTILLAIEFAFFGLIKGDVNGSTLLRHGKREGSVELHFEIGENQVAILRKLKRGKDDSVTQDCGQIIVNQKVFDGTAIELKSRVLELFGYPQELITKNAGLIYRYTVYTPQEDMKKILFESKDDRLDTLRKIFNIDKYKRIRENALMYAKELRNSKKILESKCSDLDQLKKSLESLNESKNSSLLTLDKEQKNKDMIKVSYDKKKDEIQDYEKKIMTLNILKKDLEIAKLDIKNKMLELDKNSKELGMVEYRINDYSKRLEDLGPTDMDPQSIKAALDDAEDKFNKVKNAKEVISKRLEDKERDLSNLLIDDVAALNYNHALITKRLQEKEAKEKSLIQSQDSFDKSVIELNIINVNKQNSQKIINQLKDLSSCPTCLQTVDFSHKVKILDKENANIQVSERKFSELMTKRKEFEEQVKEIKKQLDDLRKDEMMLREISTKLSHIARQQESKQLLIKEIEELKLKKDKLDQMDTNKLVDIISKNRKMLSNCELKKHIEESLKEKISQKDEMQKAQLKLSDELKEITDARLILEDKVAAYEDVQKEYDTRRKELEDLSKDLSSAEITVVSLKKDIENLDKEIMKITGDIRIKSSYKEKIERMSELNFWITEHFVNLTSTMEKIIMQKIHMEFNELFQKWFKMLIEDENMDVRVDEEFTPIVIQDSYETEVSSLSGGEKTSVALAYRLALNKVINDLISTISTKDIIILDEPTDGFSSEQLDKMREVLDELSMKQLIIVSHETKIESFVHNIIRINKNEHQSQIIG